MYEIGETWHNLKDFPVIDIIAGHIFLVIIK